MNSAGVVSVSWPVTSGWYRPAAGSNTNVLVQTLTVGDSPEIGQTGSRVDANTADGSIISAPKALLTCPWKTADKMNDKRGWGIPKRLAFVTYNDGKTDRAVSKARE